nr:hypothetical transcript [Hymenolepis microstoma]
MDSIKAVIATPQRRKAKSPCPKFLGWGRIEAAKNTKNVKIPIPSSNSFKLLEFDFDICQNYLTWRRFYPNPWYNWNT